MIAFITPSTKIVVIIALFIIPIILILFKEKEVGKADTKYGLWLPMYLILILADSFVFLVNLRV